MAVKRKRSAGKAVARVLPWEDPGSPHPVELRICCDREGAWGGTVEIWVQGRRPLLIHRWVDPTWRVVATMTQTLVEALMAGRGLP